MHGVHKTSLPPGLEHEGYIGRCCVYMVYKPLQIDRNAHDFCLHGPKLLNCHVAMLPLLYSRLPKRSFFGRLITSLSGLRVATNSQALELRNRVSPPLPSHVVLALQGKDASAEQVQ